MKKILITGALGQIGSELTVFLRKKYGKENVIASDIKQISSEKINQIEPFEHIDCLDAQAIFATIKNHKIDAIFHLAAILSAKGENNPQLAWKININGLYNVLEIENINVPSSLPAQLPLLVLPLPKITPLKRQFKDPIPSMG